ncbi:MAG: lysine--tRNA ligase [Methanomassiliicoccaceae archaeon]|nr:lysine--tRNA ligase [Methanomassiliicoccaceae archaeon]
MHWADVIAEEIIEEFEEPLIANGISPSGTIHVGSLREAITGETIRRTIEGMGRKVRLIYLIDSLDQLKKRADFLPEWYEGHVGKPICYMPCPCGNHDNYAHHFAQPFLDAIERLGVECDVIWTHELYERGEFAEAIDTCFKRREEIIRLLHEVSGREAKGSYAPYTPICRDCGRFADPVFDSYSFPTLEYTCPCGCHGTADIRKGDGKLTWRLEWPAKWKIFGTSAEPYGKDHAAAGGSYDSGKRIVEEIYGGKAPYSINYEFVQLKGEGQMHKSSGSSVSGLDAIGMMPPEVLSYLFLRVNPSRAIDFDPGLGVLDMSDEYDRMERLYFEGGFTEAEENSVLAYERAQHGKVPKELPLQVPYRHIVNVVQMADSFDKVLEVLGRTIDLSEAGEGDIERIRVRADCARFWLNGFAPDSVKFSVYPTVPQGVALTMGDRAFFQKLVERMNDAKWEADTISQIISDTGKESPIGLKAGFKVIYQVVIGKDAGPRLGPFLASMDKQFVVNRFIQASRHGS